MKILGQIDWNLLSFVTLSLAKDHLPLIYTPKIYYWHCHEREGEKKTLKRRR